MRIINGNALDVLKTLQNNSVHCCVTSPPYWGLRDYGTEPSPWPEVTFVPMSGLSPVAVPAMTCNHGLEPDILSYVAHEVAIFREVKRVLRDDGTMWVNLGDSYSHNGSGTRGPDRRPKQSRNDYTITNIKKDTNNKPKDLMGIPWRVAFALQADGWYLRCDVIWSKPNPMPESVYDRPTKAHEYIFQFSKSQKYFFDQEAVKEPVTGTAHPRGNGAGANIPTGWDTSSGGHNKLQGRYNNVSRLHRQKYNDSFNSAVTELVDKRNIRSVWIIPTQGFKEAHFATFPEKLVEPCIKAGTSEKGCCPECGAPWVRITEKTKSAARKASSPHAAVPGQHARGTFINERHDEPSKVTTIGWQPTCDHNHEPIPCKIIDPFVGSGTTGVVANKLDRDFIGIELNPIYLKMAEKRIYEVAPLFADISECRIEAIEPLFEAVNR